MRGRPDRVNRIVLGAAEAQAVELSDRGEEWAALTIVALLSIIEDLTAGQP